jgi:hypothetical protein
MKRIVRDLILLMIFACPASRAATSEYQLEAVFLFNFTQFVEWPATVFERPDSPLAICVLGEDPFGDMLDNIVRDESVSGHPIIINRYRDASMVNHCHILFFSRSEMQSFKPVLQSLKNSSVLTVAGFEGFALSGGIIRFLVVENKLRLRINMIAMRDAKLEISSKLLRQADLIGHGED